MDGRIASADHSLEFLDAMPGQGPDDFDDFIAGVDGVLLGAETLRWLVRHGHRWPHDDLPTWLVSHDEELAESVRPTRAPLVRVAGGLQGAIELMERSGRRRVWLAGAVEQRRAGAERRRGDRCDHLVETVELEHLGCNRATPGKPHAAPPAPFH